MRRLDPPPARCRGRAAAVLPGIGSKELVASLPRMLGLSAGDRVVIPRIAYPTYAVGAVLAGAEPVATDEPETVEGAALVWLNSPGNPTGSVLAPERMAQIVAWARETGAIVVSDECYVELGWDAEPVSVLHPDVCGDDHARVLAVHSLSKRSNLAGYRFGFAAGDPSLVAGLRQHRESCKSVAITYIDGDAGHPALPRLPDRAAGREVDLPRDLLPADLRRAADRRGARRPSPRRSAAHDAARGPAKRFFDGFPRDAHPMPVLSSAVTRCRRSTRTRSTPFDPSRSRSRRSGCWRRCRRSPPTPTRSRSASRSSTRTTRCPTVENFLRMMFGVPAEPYDVDPRCPRRSTSC
jgi:hypothetical protein